MDAVPLFQLIRRHFGGGLRETPSITVAARGSHWMNSLEAWILIGGLHIDMEVELWGPL